jgi:myo-inositol-1-phosphate synthase
MGRLLDGVAEHMLDYPRRPHLPPRRGAGADRDEVVAVLREAEADVMMNYLPVGSQQASEFYAECALEAGVAFVNNIPVFIASDPAWADRFERPACRSSATTSRRRSARRSSTAC